MEDFALKIYAARQTIGDRDFFLVARTDARATSAKRGLDDAITRCNLYLDAGADATLIEAPQSDEEIRAIAQGTKVSSSATAGLTSPYVAAAACEVDKIACCSCCLGEACK